MKKFEAIIAEYKEKEIKEEHILYAVEHVKKGTQREIIVDALTESYRGVDYSNANALVDDLYTAGGNEFKKANTSAIMYGVLLLGIGLFCSFAVYNWYVNGGALPRIVFIGIVGLPVGLYFLIKGLRKKFTTDILHELNEQ